MESSIGGAEKQSRATKKLIPWHCQKRYQTSLSQQSVDYSVRTTAYKKRIKSLLENNRNLARALEGLKNDKENMYEKNNQNMDIIDISRVKLKEILENLKKVTVGVDETVVLLQSQVEPSALNRFHGQIMPRTIFKKTLKAAANFEALEEVAEDLEVEQNSNDVNTVNLNTKHVLQDKSKPKAKRISPKTVSLKRDGSTAPKAKKKSSSAKTEIASKAVTVRSSKSCVDETPPSYLLGISSDSESFHKLVEQTKNESKTFQKNVQVKTRSEEKHRLGQCADNSILNSGFIQYDVKETRKSTSILKRNVDKVSDTKVPTNNKMRKSAFIKKVAIMSPQRESQSSSKDSWSTSDDSTAESNNKPLIEANLEISKNCTASSKPHVIDTEAPKDFPNVLEANATSSKLRICLERTDFEQNCTLGKKQTVSVSEIIPERKSVPKLKIKLKSNKKNCNTSHKKVGFILEDESDKIEMLKDPITELPKTQKRPLKEGTQNIAALPSKKRAKLTSVASEEKGQNTFLVTAEIHKPPDSYVSDEALFEDRTCFFKMQPTVVLTDIFGSTRQKNKILEKVCSNTDELVNRYSQIEEKNSDEQNSDSDASDNFNMQCNKENKILLEDRRQNPRQRSIVPSYKEMKLNAKMRRS